MWPSCDDGVGHVGQAEATRGFEVGEDRLDLGPRAVARLAQQSDAAECVGIRQTQGAVGAVDLDAGQRRRLDVKGGDDGAHGTAVEVQQPHHMGRHIHRHDGPLERLAQDRALGPGDTSGPGDTAHVTQRSDQGGKVVRPHVEHGSTAGFVVELGAGVPMFVAAAHHESGGRHRRADDAVVDEFARRLQPAAQEGVGRAADAQSFGGGEFEQFLSFRSTQRQRFLAVDRLARFQRGLGHTVMRAGNREIEHDVDLRIGQQFVHTQHTWDVPLSGGGFGGFPAQIGHRCDFNRRQPLRHRKILFADVATANHADTGGESVHA